MGVGTSNRLDFVQMIVINGDGSQPHVVAKFGRPKLAIYAPQRGVWSPDARSLAVNRFDSIWIISAKTGVRRARIRGDFWTVWDWQVLPGRRGVRFTG